MGKDIVSVKQRSVLTQQHLAGQEVAMEDEEHLPSTQLPMSSITPDASNVGPRIAGWCFIIRGVALSNAMTVSMTPQ